MKVLLIAVLALFSATAWAAPAPAAGEPSAIGLWEQVDEGAEKDAPVLGLALIKGMKRSGLSYEGGTIMDPRDGTVYRALMNLSPDGKKLEVRGFLGYAVFGRSQTWNRLPDNAMDPPRAAPKAAPKK
jgi:uncharacterized protein (DUF2147 family)